MPTISPARSVTDTSLKAPCRPRPRTSSRTGAASSPLIAEVTPRSRPVMARTRRGIVTSATGQLPTRRPSFKTVTRSAIWKTSSSRCEM